MSNEAVLSETHSITIIRGFPLFKMAAAFITWQQYLASISFPVVFEREPINTSPTKSAGRRFPAQLFASPMFNNFAVTAASSGWFGAANTTQMSPNVIFNGAVVANMADNEKRMCKRAEDYFRALQNCTNFYFDPGNAIVDRVITEDGKQGMTLMEIQCRWNIEEMPTTSNAVVTRYNHYVQHPPGEGYPKWFWAIGQCMGYLHHFRRRHIILFTLTFFYVIHVEDVNGAAQVHISDRFSTFPNKTHLPLGNPYHAHMSNTQSAVINPLVTANLTANNPALLPNIDASEVVYSYCLIYAIHIGIKAENMVQDPVYALVQLQDNVANDSNGFDGNSGANICVPASDILEYIGSGRSGTVYSGYYNGSKVAFKFAEKNKLVKEFDEGALRREMKMYEKFKNCQGKLLPKIMCPKVTSGNVNGFCMEFLSPLPSSFKNWTEGQRTEAILVLDSLLLHGLMQDDIRASNFGVNSEGKIVMFDLEDCSEIDEGDCEMKSSYMESIRGIVCDIDCS